MEQQNRRVGWMDAEVQSVVVVVVVVVVDDDEKKAV
jgi:hypothetical protein